MITQSAIRQITCKFHSLDLSRENAVLHKSTALDSSVSSEKRIILHESSTLNSFDSSTALLLSAAGEKSVLQLIRDVQKLDPQCR